MKQISPLVQKFQEFWSEACQELSENKEFQKKCKIAVASVSKDIETRFPSFESNVKQSQENFQIDALSVLIDMMDPAKSVKKSNADKELSTADLTSESKSGADQNTQDLKLKKKMADIEAEAQKVITKWQDFKEELKFFLQEQGIGMIDSSLQN